MAKMKQIITETEAQFGYIKGTAKWAHILEPNQYDSFSIDIYGEEVEQLVDEVLSVLQSDGAKEVDAAGKKYQLADLYKTNEETGEKYLQFKLKDKDYEGKQNKIKLYDAGGSLVTEWDKLIGNGSIVKIKYRSAPYYMNSTKMVGVSNRFYAVQVIKLEEYKGGADAGFGDETSEGSSGTEGDIEF